MWLCWPCHARHDAPRRPRGEEHAMAKLTEDEVREIRQHAQSRAFTHKQLAATFGVSRFAIQSVIYRKSWAHVE